MLHLCSTEVQGTSLVGSVVLNIPLSISARGEGMDHLWEMHVVLPQTKKGNTLRSRIPHPLKASQVALCRFQEMCGNNIMEGLIFPCFLVCLLKGSVKHYLCWSSELWHTGFHPSSAADVFVKLQRNIDIKQPQECFNTSFEKWQIYINYLRCWEKNYPKFSFISSHFTVSLEFLPKKKA